MKASRFAFKEFEEVSKHISDLVLDSLFLIFSLFQSIVFMGKQILILDELLYHVYLKTQVMKGLEQIRQGKGIPQNEIEAEISHWLK